MQRFKKYWNLMVILLGAPVLLYAVHTVDRKVVDGTEIYELLSDGSIELAGYLQLAGSFISDDPFKHGSNGTASSVTLPTAVTGSNFADWVPCYNPTSSAIPVGSVLVASNTGVAYVNISPATIDLTGVVGVAAAEIPATSNGWMVPRGGGYVVVKTTGTVAIGDVLITSGTVAGRLGVDNTPTTGADVAIAMDAGTAAGDDILAIMR